jgi:hypothetical protein
MITSARHLVFHGTLVLLFGLLLGAPYAKAINRSAPAHIVNSWRVAHQSLPIAAILMFSVAALLPSFAVSPAVGWIIAGSLIASSYFFCVSMPLAAITGHRGLTRGKTTLENTVLVANIAGAWLSVIATLALVYAAAASL